VKLLLEKRRCIDLFLMPLSKDFYRFVLLKLSSHASTVFFVPSTFREKISSLSLMNKIYEKLVSSSFEGLLLLLVTIKPFHFNVCFNNHYYEYLCTRPFPLMHISSLAPCRLSRQLSSLRTSEKGRFVERESLSHVTRGSREKD